MNLISCIILKTLAYADVFDYPLNEKEIYRFLISKFQIPCLAGRQANSKFQKELTALSANICRKEGFYFLKGRQKIVEIRKKREKWSREKFKIARRVARWLQVIPWIKMVGITGALAMNNATKDDDVDILIITAKNRLWLTRLLVVILLEILGCRRRPSDLPANKQVNNKICLNMLLDEDHLTVPERERDLFTAHETCQLKPIYNKDDAYQKFIQANIWVKKFLANGLDTKIPGYYDIKKKKRNSLSILMSQYLNILEKVVYKIQLVYMKSRKTTEITEPGRVLFHPRNCRNWILKEYHQRLR